MYIISVMIFTFSIKDFWHPKFLNPNLDTLLWKSWKVPVLDSSLPVLLDEYPCARVSIIFQDFPHHFVLSKLATCSIRVKCLSLFFPGTMVVNFVLPLEFVGPRWRTFCGCIGFWACGVMSLALMAFYIRDWRYLSIATSVGGIFLLFTYW